MPQICKKMAFQRISEDFRGSQSLPPFFARVYVSWITRFSPKAAKGGPHKLEPVRPKATAKWLSAWISSQADTEDLSGNGWFHFLGLKHF